MIDNYAWSLIARFYYTPFQTLSQLLLWQTIHFRQPVAKRSSSYSSTSPPSFVATSMALWTPPLLHAAPKIHKLRKLFIIELYPKSLDRTFERSVQKKSMKTRLCSCHAVRMNCERARDRNSALLLPNEFLISREK